MNTNGWVLRDGMGGVDEGKLGGCVSLLGNGWWFPSHEWCLRVTMSIMESGLFGNESLRAENVLLGNFYIDSRV